MNPDSPTQKEKDIAPQCKSVLPTRTSLPMPKSYHEQQTKVNAVMDTSEDKEEADSSQSSNDSSTDSSDFDNNNHTTAITLEISSIKVPKSDKTENAFKQYSILINAIEADKKLVVQKPCVVCQKKHSFDNCKVLKTSIFCRHIIFNIVLVSVKKLPRSKAGIDRPIPISVNFLDKYTNNPSDSDSNALDFQTGCR